jgi:hypothetical protein
MNQRNSIVRRNLRAYAAAFISYVILAGQFAPLALAAAPKRAAAPPAPASAPATAAPLSAAPMPAPMPFFAPAITATKVDSFPDPNANGKAEPGDTITYTVTINNTGPDPATGVTFTDSVDTNTSLVAGSVQTQPVAQADTFTAFGNVRISTANGAANLLANDCDPDDTTPPCNSNLTASGPTTGPTNGQATVNADGSFSYNPNPGFTGTDSFTYTVRDAGPDTVPGNADDKTDTATATITVGPTLVWFINNAAAPGGDGRIATPFNSIAAYNASAPTKDPGDIIFIHTGGGNYTGGLALANTQKVIGQGFNLATETGAPPAGSDTLPPAGAAPTIDNPGLNVITLAQNNTLRGFNTGNTGAAGTDIAGTSFGTLTVSNLSINGDGRALNLTTGTLAATVASISASNTGTNTGITLNGVGGALTVSGTTTVTNPGGNGIDVTNAPAGSNHNFGTTSVSKNAAGVGVNIATNNAGATTAFTSLTITTSTGIGLSTNAGGTVNASAGSITATGAGAAASLTNTALGLTFTSVSSNGGLNGILISGGSGSFSSGTTNLQNNGGLGLSMSGSAVVANFGNTTVNSSAGDAVDLATNTGNITFADLDMTPDAGFRGLDATGNTQTITVTSGDITTSGGGTASAVFIDGPAGRTGINLTFTSVTTSGVGNSIHLQDVSGTKFQVTGTTQINTRSTTNGGAGVFVDNSTATTIQFATVNVPNPSNAGGQGFRVQNSSSAVTVATATISGANQTVAQTDGDADGVADSDGDGDGIFLKTNTGSFTLSAGSITSSGGDAIDIRTATNVTISGVSIDGVGLDGDGSSVGGEGGHGIYALDVTGTSSLTNVTITNWETAATNAFRWWNRSGTGTFNVNGCTFSNSETGSGAIIYRADNTAVMTFNVGVTTPNNFTNLFGEAIGHAAGNSAGSTATANLTVQNNNFTNNAATKGQNSISARNTEAGKATVVITGNTFDGVGRTGSDTSGVIDIGGDALLAANSISFTVTNNIIRNIGDNIANSCGALECHGKRGIDVFIDDNSNVSGTLTLDGNIITNVQRMGVVFDVGSTFNGANFAAKITNNRIGIRADNTIDRVGLGDALAAGGENGIRVENRNENAKNLNILVSNNLVYNANGAAGSLLNSSGMLIRTQGTATMSATVTNNTVNVNNSSASVGFNVQASGPAGSNSTLCFDASGNSITAPGGGFSLAEALGTLNVEQANSGALSAANGGASVTIAAGSPNFGVACATPPAAPVGFDSDLVEGGPGGLPVGAPSEVPAAEATGSAAGDGATARPLVAKPRATAAPKAAAPAAKRGAGSTLRYAAADTSAPLNPVAAPEPVAQKRRKVEAPVLMDDPGPPNGSGGTVTINIGTLPANDSVTITFQVVVDNPYGGGPNVSNQGTVSGTNFTTVNGVSTSVPNTDDPDAAGAANPTLTPINAIDIRVNDAKVAEPASPNTIDMVFTVSLSQPAGGPVSVNFATSDQTATAGTCGNAGADYVTTGGTVGFTAGQQVKTINVPVCSDALAEGDETFLVTLSGAVGGNIVDATAVGTITANTPGSFIISELRTSGPGGLGDDFVEFYNNTNSPLTVAASDGSAGYGLYKMGADCNATPVLIATIPNGTVIPARGHYLAVGSQYTLANYGGTGAAAGNVTLTSDIESDRNVAVFTTANVINISSLNRLDAVGFGLNTGAVCDLTREPGNLPATGDTTADYSFFRDMRQANGGNPKDTNDNSADFIFADTGASIISGVPQRLGAPGPENLASPIRRDNSGIGAAFLDGSVSTSAHPNRTRSFTMVPNGTWGTLTVRRRFVNNTGGPVMRLRYRIVEITTFPSPGGGVADLRALTSADEPGVTPVNDQTTCTASGAGAAPCTVTVRGTTLEEPPAQASNGGGMNSTLSSGTITTGTPLANGASINVRFVLGIQTTGTFRFLIIVEALP